MLQTVLIANRGEIALRILKTLKKMGIKTIAVYSDADYASPHVAAADIAVRLPGNTTAETYLRSDLILAIAKAHHAEAVIPGYGFLSENADFAEACTAAGIVFIGPTAKQIRQFGLKHTSREIAARAGVPLVPGTGLLSSLDAALTQADAIGYPVMLKSTAGGGGIGMTRCATRAELEDAFTKVKHQALNFFKDAGVFLEHCIDNARHIEVQIFGNGKGRVLTLGERDCSLQRRNQKVVEETPAPDLPETTRQKIQQTAKQLGESVHYQSAGTVEFIYDRARDEFYFLEVNTRLQVEHPITEAVFGIDLVEWMVKLAAHEFALPEAPLSPQGTALEVRIYAENPLHDFTPSPGELTEVHYPRDVRVDGYVATGSVVSPYYDPMLAKLIVHGDNRRTTIQKMQAALSETRFAGITTNLDYLREIMRSEDFIIGKVSTKSLNDFHVKPCTIEVLQPGTYTTIQDYPGREGYWDIGVPPSGPMDDYAFRLANQIIGNPSDAAGIECTFQGSTLQFLSATVIALTGASSQALLDGKPLAMWTPIAVTPGQTLSIGNVTTGCRCYLAVLGGVQVPRYLGSRATFVLGHFGGYAGRTLQKGDLLPLNPTATAVHPPQAAPQSLIPNYTNHWEIAVLYGPHGAPDFFTEASIETFFATQWKVHYNANRLGLRLIGPKPEWTRRDGGEAGLHPSNVHDCEYAIGAINFTGDMPVILGCDGPSLGGFVCPATIIQADLWKMGQVKPGDTIHFYPVDFAAAVALEKQQDLAIKSLNAPDVPLKLAAQTTLLAAESEESATILSRLPATDKNPLVVYRQAGDKHILEEYGPNELDIHLRLRIHAIMEALCAQKIAGLLELSPGVRSLQIHYDSRRISQQAMLDVLIETEKHLPPLQNMHIATRIVHLPMAFEDTSTLDAQKRYSETVKADAPWMPNNVDFIQRMNGLATRDEVKETIFSASYLVMGLGDVYLGAPCAVPLDPRHRLITSKYNPARTYTAEGAVGIGGVYMCIYGMDSPGGYQLVGRTLPIWNKFTTNTQFTENKPWLLRFFDQVKFYEVSEAELTELRRDFRCGRMHIEIEETSFNIAEYEQFLQENASSIAAFKEKQNIAFQREVALWESEEESVIPETVEHNAFNPHTIDGAPVTAAMYGSVWNIVVEEGQTVAIGDPLIVLEAMKMEVTINAEVAGSVQAILCKPGMMVETGDILIVIKA